MCSMFKSVGTSLGCVVCFFFFCFFIFTCSNLPGAHVCISKCASLNSQQTHTYTPINITAELDKSYSKKLKYQLAKKCQHSLILGYLTCGYKPVL